MKNIIICLIFASVFGCKPSNKAELIITEVNGVKIFTEDIRAILLGDFNQITKYTQFTDGDYKTGHFNYWFYKEEDFLNISISGVTDERIINDSLEEFKSVMKKRNIEMPIKVYIYEETISTSDTTATSRGLIRKFEIN